MGLKIGLMGIEFDINHHEQTNVLFLFLLDCILVRDKTKFWSGFFPNKIGDGGKNYFKRLYFYFIFRFQNNLQ